MNSIFLTLCRVVWTDKIESVKPRRFSHAVGSRVIVPNSFIGIFQLFFTIDLLEYIVQESNRYAQQCMQPNVFEEWQQITVPELQAFFGFMILMGLVELPALSDYWKKDHVYHYSPIADRISRTRFQEINRYLHFANNANLTAPGSAEYNKLGKIQPIIDVLNSNFKDTYNLNKEASIDEAMIRFKGRSSMKQYLPLKPTKRGFKVWVLADGRNGYVSSLEVYKGKDGKKSDVALGESVVTNLCKTIEGR